MVEGWGRVYLALTGLELTEFFMTFEIKGMGDHILHVAYFS